MGRVDVALFYLLKGPVVYEALEFSLRTLAKIVLVQDGFAGVPGVTGCVCTYVRFPISGRA